MNAGADVTRTIPDRVVVVGGGTAGWMTASYLKAAFGHRVSVTVVESSRIGTIGVGEATFSDIRHFFEFLDLKEEDWMPACNATYKLAVRFQDWRRPGHHFYHPFEKLPSVGGFPLTDWWLRNGPTERFDADCFVLASLCDAERSPRRLDGSLLDRGAIDGGSTPMGLTMSEHQGATQFPYAYHFEAALLAKYLCQYAVDRGVRHVVDDVEDVLLDQRGWITSVRGKESGEIHGDLFVDCTGFKGLLLNKALEVPFVSYQESLPNDSAVALQVPLDMRERGIPPYTQATAQEAGWIWTIPLFGRIGTGYVYASDYCAPDEAERVLREFAGPAAADAEANHIRMRIGRSAESWVRNCVAIGLSSGFVEPLESTGIFFIHHAIEQLVKHFPDAGWSEHNRGMYNSAVGNVMDGVREFLTLHYLAAERSDTQYWRDAAHRPMPDGMAERLERWKVQLPDTENIFPYYHGLPPYSYMCILLGMGGIATSYPPAVGLSDDTAAQKEFAAIRGRAGHLIESLPNQYDYFAQMRKGSLR
ncbi:tryptophan halogenase [Lentzea flaviverrucosa]|uniref:Tryptophan halogenase n=1 Tax=Lentzea flaviverrucosa TaxID=200379 RepID=A0A1H9SG03_9PSEU|nr:tryptophan halogenase [Lentzea flaviverrucosa]SER83535.1 tryptophan halogenase [Lentzea flaviverrucosa]